MKFFAIIIFVLVFELVGLIGRAIGRLSDSSAILRKITMLDKAFKQSKNKQAAPKNIKQTVPIMTVSRTFDSDSEEEEEENDQRPKMK